MKRFQILVPVLLSICLTSLSQASSRTLFTTSTFTTPTLDSWLTQAGSHNRPASYDRSMQYLTEHQILDEIERIQSTLDDVTREGRIDNAIATAVAGVLGTVAYGVAHAQIVWMFAPYFYSTHHCGRDIPVALWINAVLRGVIDSILPGLGIGATLGAANYFIEGVPYLPIDDVVLPGLTAIVSSLGTTLTLSVLLPSPYPWPWKMLQAAAMSLSSNTIALFSYILLKRKDLHEDHLNLQYRLQEAKEALKNREAVSERPHLR